MSNKSHASRLIEAAEHLLAARPRSAAFRRRAVSTAYYALFHAVAKICADYVTRFSRRDGEDYLRIYRALDHRSLKNSFSQVPLRDDADLKRLGAVIVRLQAERHKADYLPPLTSLFPLEEAQQLVALAKQALTDLEGFEPNGKEAKLLALSLLFRERQP